MRFEFDPRKSARLRSDRRRGIGFEEALELFEADYYLDLKSDDPTQYRVVGWVRGVLCTVIVEPREDDGEEVLRLVSLWKATREERELYENSQ